MKKGYMNAIEQTKHDGAVNALVGRLNSLIFNLTNTNWDGIRTGNRFVRLNEAIDNADKILDEIHETLAALIEMEPDNN